MVVDRPVVHRPVILGRAMGDQRFFGKRNRSIEVVQPRPLRGLAVTHNWDRPVLRPGRDALMIAQRFNAGMRDEKDS